MSIYSPGVFCPCGSNLLRRRRIHRREDACYADHLQTGLPANGTLTAMPDVQGDVWLAGQTGGLFANTSTATAPSLTAVGGIQDAYHLGFGAPANGGAKPTLYLDGQVGGTPGICRSIDGGITWIQINDTAHQWGGLEGLCGDMRTFGTVYLATAGRGIIWGTSPN